MAAARRVKRYSLLLHSRTPFSSDYPTPPFSRFSPTNDRRRCFSGKSRTLSAEGWERRATEEKMSDSKVRPARAKQAVNHDFGEILACDGMRFLSSHSSFVPSLLDVIPAPFLFSVFFFFFVFSFFLVLSILSLLSRLIPFSLIPLFLVVFLCIFQCVVRQL